MMSADFVAAAVLISFGAVLGKTSPLQLLVMTLIEVVLQQLNEYIGVHELKVSDVGESMFVHAFGAYFGLAVARVLYSDKVEESNKEGSIYHSDLFSMIGTIFLWIFWPSFNGGAATGDEQHRAVINTLFSLTACTFITFAVSSILHKRGKFEMVHIQNATLAGGVAVGTCANMPMGLWGALVIGTVAGILSTVGFKYLTPFLASKAKLHDTCGVNNLHGMPGILAGLAGAVMAALATADDYGPSLQEIFPARGEESKNGTASSGRSASVQGGYQMLALIITLAIAIVGGALTGLILKLSVFDGPDDDDLFDDGKHWEVADDGFDGCDKQPINDANNMTNM
ncbi:ammonium transporter Rh type B-like [Gigantopelta aegis]|uniref:ammonium transporter Rh type B-like n=1 Tax=Gigantopelta aegis TaxID=1735272 RepID=UPI001B88E171|nr:ammonium transporter Rh type B-like [Gigantopelta aegis]